MYSKPSGGWIEVVCGSMFSGKTEELIRRVRRAKIARQKVQVFKPAIDTRYAEREVTSHNGLQVEAVPVENTAQVRELVEPDTTVVALDEVQFFDQDVVALCEELADRGARVIVAGLDMDFRGVPFGPVPALVARFTTPWTCTKVGDRSWVAVARISAKAAHTSSGDSPATDEYTTHRMRLRVSRSPTLR